MSTITNTDAGKHSATPGSMFRSIWENRGVIWLLAKRDIQSRYKGSYIGLVWALINPLLMLLIYTFVFSVIFRARWAADAGESRTQFAFVMFVGVIVHGMFAEVVNRAPGIVLENTNYVTKVVFPLQILPVISLGNAIFQGLAGTVVLLLGMILSGGGLHWHALMLPLVFAPLLIMMVGIGWMLAALGVFIRDLKQTTMFVTTALLFLSPVFYPQSAWPQQYQWLFLFNPLTFIMEQSRQVLIWGAWPDLLGLLLYSLAALGIAWLGYFSFQRLRTGFADVL
ncbi:ABC transporter permease [Luteimonas sp. FCS-9]|uniref:ABC transporter permease n=1 Tax=Luteimonas sp. FCS-9 TaxID=1547516 RepID=UPI00063E94E3|nr:ABC transporter permease [Luteimonas sp. FCS-9]KLI98608.1 hypothetical protein WQ56_14800 [Luteimonas sp. FCS-9]